MSNGRNHNLHHQSHHGHGYHAHSYKVKNYNRAFSIGIALNILFVIIEAVYGILADSLALLADAGHNLSDVLSLILAWGAFWLSQKPKTLRRTFGYRKITIIASTVSAVMLFFVLGGIAWEALQRFERPEHVDGLTVIAVAGIGVVVNTLTALLFMSGRKYDLNIKGAFLHMAADAAVSIGVVTAGLVIMKTGWLVVDPIISILIVILTLQRYL